MWYADFKKSADATLTVDPGLTTGAFSFTSQVDLREPAKGNFRC
jgi:hypothetical protein